MSGNNELEDLELIYFLSRAHSLAEVPGKNNWIEKTSDEGLPDYISRIAKHIMQTGKSKSVAIASAISQVKKWAAGGENVHPDTRAKAAAALAQWEKLKAKNKARTASKKIAMSNIQGKLEAVMSPYELLSLSVSYSLDGVKTAFDQMIREARSARRAATGKYGSDDPMDYMWVREVWTDYVIASSDYGNGKELYRYDYSVGKDGKVTFADPVKVVTKYVTVKDLADSEGEVAAMSAESIDAVLDLDERISLSNSRKFAEAIVGRLSQE
jgi:hypothetical protein